MTLGELPQDLVNALDPRDFAVLTDGAYDVGALYHFAELLASPDNTLARIRDIVRSLSAYAVTPETIRNPDTQTGWNIILDFLEEKSGVFTQNQSIALLNGSLLYDDARHGKYDFDIDVISRRPMNLIFPKIVVLEHRLRQIWPTRGAHDGTMTVVSLHDISTYMDWYTRRSMNLLQRYSSHIEMQCSESSVIFTSAQFWTLAQEAPLLAAAICCQLEFTLDIRQKRREGFLNYTGPQS